jgi:hypothetical protein
MQPCILTLSKIVQTQGAGQERIVWPESRYWVHMLEYDGTTMFVTQIQQPMTIGTLILLKKYYMYLVSHYWLDLLNLKHPVALPIKRALKPQQRLAPGKAGHTFRLKRYHELVEKKYLAGLSLVETEEMERLGQEIDADNAPFYDRIFETLSESEKCSKGGIGIGSFFSNLPCAHCEGVLQSIPALCSQ